METKAPNRIRELRGKRSLDWLAERSGLSRNSINLMERGEQELTLEKMRLLAPALGIRPSELLNDEDVELRAGPEAQAFLRTLSEVPVEARGSLADAAMALVKLSHQLALRETDQYFSGDADHVSQLATLWNAMGAEQKTRTISLLQASGLADQPRQFISADTSPARARR